MTGYSARAFLRQTINQEGSKVELPNDANQINQIVSSNRFVITAGQFSTLDIFDDSKYAKDPRVQFMNWGNMTYLAYDYAADARGYSWGLAGEWYRDNWVFRASRMLTPKIPNQLNLNWQIFNAYGDQIEVERQHNIGDLPGKVSVLSAVYRRALGCGLTICRCFGCLSLLGMPRQTSQQHLLRQGFFIQHFFTDFFNDFRLFLKMFLSLGRDSQIFCSVIVLMIELNEFGFDELVDLFVNGRI